MGETLEPRAHCVGPTIQENDVIIAENRESWAEVYTFYNVQKKRDSQRKKSGKRRGGTHQPQKSVGNIERIKGNKQNAEIQRPVVEKAGQGKK